MSQWDRETTAEEVAKFFAEHIRNKTILVTGVSPKGLGAQFVETIAPYEPKCLVLAGRDPGKTRQTANYVKSIAPNVAVRTLALDLSSLKQIRQAAHEVNTYDEGIDVLVNNAGIMASPFWKTEDGLEAQFGTNYIGPFLFTNLIMNKVTAVGTARIVNVSSDGHRLSPIRFDDYGFQDGKSYSKWRAYGQAKTATMLFAISLAKKLGKRGLTALSLHPGQILTPLGRHMGENDIESLRALDQELGNKEGSQSGFNFRTLSQGAATHVVAAFDPSLESHNGGYLQDCRIAPAEDTKPYAVDGDQAEKLWSLSESIVGEKFSY